MPVNSSHPEYQAVSDQWKRCRDCFAGEDAIKERAEAYLPRLTGQDDIEYRSYVKRASFYGAFARTIAGLTGAAIYKPFDFSELPTTLEAMKEDATNAAESLDELVKHLLTDQLVVGHIGLLVDRSATEETNTPYLVHYAAEQIISWEEGADGTPKRVVLEESVLGRNSKDPYVMEKSTQWRELLLDDAGNYMQKIWAKSKTVDSTFELKQVIIPTMKGKPLDFIPFVAINSNGIGLCPIKPPLLDLADLNLSHYRNSADLEHGRHYTGLPFLFIAGMQIEKEIRIGSSAAIVAPEPTANAHYVEFTGAGLGTLENALESKEKQMAVLGARLLEQQRTGVEAADTVRMRNMGDTFSLITMNTALADGLSLALSYADLWQGGDGVVTVEPNLDFTDTALTPQEILALMQLWQSGGISLDTLLFNLQRGEVLPPGTDLDEEKALIEANGSTMQQLPILTPAEKFAANG